MDVDLQLLRWSHECCGRSIERWNHVELTAVRPDGSDDVVEGVGWLAAGRHHNASRVFVCRGVVVDLWAVDGNGTRRPVERIPSGRALRGFGEGEDGALRLLDDGSDAPGVWPLLVTVAAGTIDEVDTTHQEAAAVRAAAEQGAT